MASVKGRPHSSQNVLTRLWNLPVVSSAWALVSVLYRDGKVQHPRLRSMCEAMESGLRVVTAAAYDSATPYIIKLEPQISIVNELACKGLDQLETSLPVLHQPSDQVISSAVNLLLEARDTGAIVVNGAKDCVFYSLAVVVRGGRAQDRLELSRWMMGCGRLKGAVRLASGGVEGAMSLVNGGLDSAISLSESFLNQVLPLTEDEMEESFSPEGRFEAGLTSSTPVGRGEVEVAPSRPSPSPSVRLLSLTAMLFRRAYHKARAKLRPTRLRSTRLRTTRTRLTRHRPVMIIDGALVECEGKARVEEESQESQRQICSLTPGWTFARLPSLSSSSTQLQNHFWTHTSLFSPPNQYQGWADSSPSTELQQQGWAHPSLSSSPNQLQDQGWALPSLLRHLQGWPIPSLPLHLQHKVLCVLLSASQIYNNFSCQAPPPDAVRSHSGGMASLEAVGDYLLHNTPLNWLVGPFFPKMPSAPPKASPKAPPKAPLKAPPRGWTRKQSSKRMCEDCSLKLDYDNDITPSLR